jgi:hypothetical protein
MKKIFLLLAVVGTAILSSCEGPQGVPGPQGTNVEAEVFELRNVSFGLDNDNLYTIYQTLDPQILASDVLLIYRLGGTIDASTPIWDQIPNTYYDIGALGNQLHYDFDFSQEDFTIYAGGNYDPGTTPSYLNNQTFRIVIIPGYFSNKGNSQNAVDLSDYKAVIKAYHINDSNVKVLNK